MRVLLAWLLISRVISAEEYADEADGADLGLHERAAVEIGSSDGDVLQSELIGAMYDRRPHPLRQRARAREREREKYRKDRESIPTRECGGRMCCVSSLYLTPFV